MEEVKQETTERVEGEMVEAGTQIVPAGEMAFRLINPTEGDFLTKIVWNKAELEAAIRAKTAAYTNVVYTEDNMKQAKDDRAELNKLIKVIEDRRKMVKEIINKPYAVFEAELKELLLLIQEPVAMIDGQIKSFENQQKEEKKQKLMEVWQEAIGELADILPFDKVFDQRYLNATYALSKASGEIKEKVERFKTDLETIDSLDSKYKLNAKDVYIKTLDLSKALAENKRLVELEQRMEAERKRKEEEEAIRRQREERQRQIREEEERKRREEEEAARKVSPIERGCITGKNPNGTCSCCGNGGTVECCAQCKEDCNGRCGWLDEGKTGENVTETAENVIKTAENVSETPESVSNSDESATQPTSAMGRAIAGIERQAFDAAVTDPFAQKPAEATEKKYKTRFWATGTREQLAALTEYMKNNNIKFGKVE